jgi:anti-anti-sigma factor
VDPFRSPARQVQPPAAPLLRAETVTLDGHVLVLLHGEVDLTSGVVLAPLREQLLERGLPVLVDASDVTFLDCAGLRAVLALTSDGLPGSITAASQPVRVLLEATARAGSLPPVDLRAPGLPLRGSWGPAGTARTTGRGRGR